MSKSKYKRPELKIHGNIKEITKGLNPGGSDAGTGGDSDLPPPPD